MTTLTNDQFRKDFPEFGSVTIFPESALTFWLMVAGLMVNPNVFQDMTNPAQELLAAHHLKLEADAARIAVNGGVGGTTQGPISTKSVDKVSVGYAVESAKEDGAGSYNATIFGQRYWHLTQIYGAGGVQLGTPCPSGYIGGAWWPATGAFP